MKRSIYYNGDIITMENDQPLVEALAVEDGLIKALGSKADILALADAQTELIDLDGKTLLPGFIDGHSHIISYSSTLSTVKLQETADVEDVIGRAQQFITQNKVPAGEWVVGFGYDHNFWPSRSHPDREMLDRISTEHPILLTHQSGHMGVVNTQGLAMMGIDANTPDPVGGIIGRTDGVPNGYLEENALFGHMGNMSQPTQEQKIGWLKEAEETYLRNGITTAQDGKLEREEIELVRSVVEHEPLLLDIVGFVNMEHAEPLLRMGEAFVKKYVNGFKIGGYKIILDGSPQGRTAWLTKPYEPVAEGYCGYPVYAQDKVEEMVAKAYADDMQILAHCNGDAAADQYLEAISTVQQKQTSAKDIRPVMIHAQTVRADQVRRMADLAVIPSYFAAHTYYWGDVHLRNLGKERANKISPLKTSVEEGVIYTMHQDTPVIMPDMLETIWCAVNRITKAGVVLGAEERVTPWEALRGVTINAAYQYGEEDSKGSLRAGKRADLVILDGNPLKEAPETIKNIKVAATIKDGSVVYGTI